MRTIFVPWSLQRRLMLESTESEGNWAFGAWVETETHERDFMSLIAFPAWFLPWNRNRLPSARARRGDRAIAS